MAEVAKKEKSWIKRVVGSIGRFFKGIFQELKKVSWPTKKQVVTNTFSVLMFCLIIGAVIWLADFLLKFVVGKIYG